MKLLDSGLRRNDTKRGKQTFYELVMIHLKKFGIIMLFCDRVRRFNKKTLLEDGMPVFDIK